MPRLAPYAAHEIAILSTIPGSAGRGLPIGLKPGALPSDQASNATLNATAMRLPPGHCQLACSMVPPLAGRASLREPAVRPSRRGEQPAVVVAAGDELRADRQAVRARENRDGDRRRVQERP